MFSYQKSERERDVTGKGRIQASIRLGIKTHVIRAITDNARDLITENLKKKRVSIVNFF